jgi:predicted nucleic acid-binding protein
VRVVVDTNIVFSALLNSSGAIGRLLISADRRVQFYTCEFLREELHNHRDKLLVLTKLTDIELNELKSRVTNRIEFIHEGLLPEDELMAAEEMLRDIDIKDTPFLALNNCLDALLWTGDKALVRGLKKKGYTKTITTSELVALVNRLDDN